MYNREQVVDIITEGICRSMAYACNPYIKVDNSIEMANSVVDFMIEVGFLNFDKQPGAITDDAHLRKHDDGRSAAAAGTSDIGQYGAASSETQADGQNEQTKQVCQCEIPNYDISREWCFKCQRWTGL